MKKLLLLLCFPIITFAQDDLLDEIDSDSTANTVVSSAFKGMKIVNFESTKLAAKKDLYLVVYHRFGNINSGIKELFGLDQSVTRIHFVYGLTDRFNIGVSRTSFNKTYEFSIKYGLLRQSTKGSPFEIVGFNSMAINTFLDEDDYTNLEFADRVAYTSQLLISRKFTQKLSLQLTPTLLYENLVENPKQDNAQFISGLGGRYKLSNRVSLNLDWGYHFNRENSDVYKNPLAVGVDVETGGHVFQLHLSNAQPSFERGFLTQATGDWSTGDIFFGFNLLRVF